MDINEYSQFYDGSLHYEHADEMLHALYAPAKEDFDAKLSPSSTLFNVWPQHFAITHPYEPHPFVFYQPAPQHFVPVQPAPQQFVFLPPAPYVQPADPHSPAPSIEQDPQPPRIRCTCGCDELCTPAEIAEHETLARVAEDRELAIISRALESLRFTMALPLCDFLRQLHVVCALAETLEHDVEATTDGDIRFIMETLESMRITMNLPLCHFLKQLRKAVWRYERQDFREEHTSQMALQF